MKHFILFIFIAFFAVNSFSQALPKGMNYQAVARDQKGQVIANEDIELKIELTSLQSGHEKIYYSESHNVTTNLLGLFL